MSGTDKSIRSVILIAVLFVVLRTAWLCDDAYISFRTADNFTKGYGLTWNVGERVQAYTNPLWTFMVAAFHKFTNEIYFTSIFLSVLISLAAVFILLYKLNDSTPSSLLAVGILLLSKAFIDYSTSGLENPLSHLLIVLFCFTYLKEGKNKSAPLFTLSLIAALAMLNRPDTILLFVPAIMWSLNANRSAKALVQVGAGFTVFLMWEVFSIIYYGFPFPNTYYAKLHTGITGIEYVKQGLLYLLEAVRTDPASMLIICSACLFVLIHKSDRLLPLALGIALYVAYVVAVGGDFMAGRLLTPPLFMAVCVFSQLRVSPAVDRHLQKGIELAAAIILVSVYLVVSGSPKDSAVIRPNGIADERAFYGGATALVNYVRDQKMPSHSWILEGLNASIDAKTSAGLHVVEREAIGMFGYFAGPDVYIVDVLALADPFLSRLPAQPGSRIGHFIRTLPEGYLESRKNSKNLLVAPELRALYDQIVLITQGEIFDKNRWRAIWQINSGKYRKLVPTGNRPRTVSIENLAAPKAEGTPWNASGNLVMQDQGIIVELGKMSFSQTLEISLDHNDTYQLEFGRDKKVVYKMLLRGDPIRPSGLRVKRLALPRELSENGFNKIKIVPVEGDGLYSVGHLLLH